MLAKPEYSSPPDEVCCWLGRRDRAVAGRGAAAKSHREDAAGRNATGSSIGKKLPAAAENHREATASKSASIRQLGRHQADGVSQANRKVPAAEVESGGCGGAGGRSGAGVGDEVLRCNLNLEAADARADKDAGLVKGALVNKGGERLLHPDGRAAAADIAG